MQDPAEEYEDVARRVAELAQAKGLTIGCAESLTSGAIAVALGAAPEASAWFRGGVVSYDEAVKRGLLGVSARKITSAACARQMAGGAAAVLTADAAVAVTGVGGPGPTDGEPAGTVFIAATVRGRMIEQQQLFDGDPAQVVHATVGAALELLAQALDDA